MERLYQRAACYVCVLFLTFLVTSLSVRAEERNPRYIYSPIYSLGIGYTWTNLDGSKRVIEYLSGVKSLSLKTEIEVFPLPHRFHLDFSSNDNNDIYLDTGYAYSDLILSRLVVRELKHNLDHYRFPETDPGPATIFDERNIDEEYQTDTTISDFFLRLKAPAYPFHLVARYFRYDKKGEVQQRFLVGTFGDMTVTSESRDIDSTTEELTLGSNGHFGPVEIEYSHGEKNFAPRAETVLVDLYPATALRPEDVYPHNLIPELRSSSDFIKVHTSYTGGIVAAVSLGSIRQSNQYSGVKRDIVVGAGEVSYIPMRELAFFLRYRYRDMDQDAPETTVLEGLNNVLNYEVHPPLDVTGRKLSLDVRIRPLRRINIIGSYSISEKERSDSDDWTGLNGITRANTFTLKVYGTLLRKVKFRGRYKYTDIKNPVYNIVPEQSHEFHLYTSYSPVPGVITVLTYNFREGRRDNPGFLDPGDERVIEEGMKSNTSYNILGLLTTALGEKTSLTLSCGYYRNRVRQALFYSTFAGDGSTDPGEPVMEKGVPYSDETVSYTVGLTHRINDKTDILLDLEHARSKGQFRTSNPLSGDIGSFSILKVIESGLSLKGRHAMTGGFGIEALLGYKEYNDKMDDSNDGKFYRAILMLTKRW